MAASLAELIAEPVPDYLLDAGDTITRVRRLNELDTILLVVRERLPIA